MKAKADGKQPVRKYTGKRLKMFDGKVSWRNLLHIVMLNFIDNKLKGYSAGAAMKVLVSIRLFIASDWARRGHENA